MTITRVSPGVWELRTRHGTLIATGDLPTVVEVWATLRRDSSDVAYGQPGADSRIAGRMRPDARLSMPSADRPRTGPRGLVASRNESTVCLTASATSPRVSHRVPPDGLRDRAAGRAAGAGAWLAVL